MRANLPTKPLRLSIYSAKRPLQKKPNKELNKLDGTWRTAIDGYVSACRDLDLLTFRPAKPNQYVSRPRYILCDLILVKLAPIATKILHSHCLPGHCLLRPWPLTFWPQYLISASLNSNTFVTINQSKFIFQAIKNNYNIINVTALERLPEKHYAH